MRFEVPEDALPPEHPARVLWNVVGTLDLTRFVEGVKAVEGTVGRRVTSPQVKLVLWLYAVWEGTGSAREIARRVQTDLAYRWIVGDLAIGHHALSKFRAAHGAALDALMTDILAALLHKDALSLAVVAQDGMRVRADATAPSYRRLPSLLECHEQAALHLKAVLAQADDPELTRGQYARRVAAAQDFQRRVAAAIATVDELQQTRKAPASPARASTTDAMARVMKMADGGFRPAYNVQFATAGAPFGGPRTIVGVRVTNIGSDMGSLTPMLDDVERRTGQLPATLLADAGHASHADLCAVAARGVEAIVAVPDRTQQRPVSPTDDPAITAWRARMDTDEAKRAYRGRASLCELTNAHARDHGLEHFLVRSLGKVTGVVLMAAIVANIFQHATTLLA